jgi:hypothetical protein
MLVDMEGPAEFVGGAVVTAPAQYVHNLLAIALAAAMDLWVKKAGRPIAGSNPAFCATSP